MEADESNENQNLKEEELPDTELKAESEDNEKLESQGPIAFGRPKPDPRPTGITSEEEDQAIG